MGSIPGLGRSPGGGHGNPFRYSCLENPMDREAWWATIYRVPESQTWLSDLAHKHPGFPAPFAKRLFFSNWIVLAPSTKIIWPHMQIVCFLTFHFIPLLSLSLSLSLYIYIYIYIYIYVYFYASTTLCMVNWFLTRMPRQFNGETIVLLLNDIGTIEYLHTKEWGWIPTHITYKIQLKQIKDLNLTTKITKLLEENIEINLGDFLLSNGFLNMTPKAQATKE